MDEIEALKSNISSLLPSRDITRNDKTDREKSASEKAKELIKSRTEAKIRKEEKALERRELAIAKRQQAEEQKKQQAEEHERYVNEVVKHEVDTRVKQTLDMKDPYFPQLENLEPAESATLATSTNGLKIAKPSSPQAMLAQEFGMPTSRPEVIKLLASLNVNLNLQLSKNDTANLLACLLTCNEQQLKAINSNPRIPMAIKIVIKRLQDDLKVGNISTLEKLWDRIFGKGEMAMSTAGQETMPGIIPNMPISREAYIVIRDTLIK